MQNADTLITANELLSRYGASPRMAIWAMIETPAAVMNIKEISQSANFVPRLEALMIGTSDLTVRAIDFIYLSIHLFMLYLFIDLMNYYS